MSAARWLVKSEPLTYSFDHLVRHGRTVWDGARNNTAALHLKAMRHDDEVLFYHSNVGMAVVGIAEVAREAFPDPSDPANRFVAVELSAVRTLTLPVTLAEMKATPALAVEFLLLDRLFPRSGLHTLLIAERCLADLDRSSAPDGRMHEARRILGQARASLEYEPIDLLLADLGQWLRSLQASCAAAGAALAEQWFGRVTVSPWLRDGVVAAGAKGVSK